MKTLTITDAKKNLGRWLQSAARGEDVGIICGADIIALHKVEVTPVADTHGLRMHDAVTPRKPSASHRPESKPPRRRMAAGRRRRRTSK